MFKHVYEKVTGTPWTTVRCVTDEFGVTPGARYRHLVANIPDDLLLSFEPVDLFRLLHDMSQGRLTETQQRYAASHLSKFGAGLGSSRS